VRMCVCYVNFHTSWSKAYIIQRVTYT